MTKSFLVLMATTAILLTTFPARAWDGDDTGKSRRSSDDSYSRGGRDRDDSYDRRSGRDRDDSYDRRSHRDRDDYSSRRDRPPIYVGRGRIYVDRDHDGIEDHHDTYDNRRAPPYRRDDDWQRRSSRDSDYDGIPDYRDSTPYGGRDTRRDRSERDSDHDGIPDRRDSTPYGPRGSGAPYGGDDSKRTKTTGGGTDGDSGRVKQPWEQNAEKSEKEREKNKGGTDSGWKEGDKKDAPWGSKENPGYGGKP